MQGGQEAMPPKFIAYAGILCVDSSVPNQILLPVSSQSICPQTICWVKTSLFLVTTCIQSACISLAPSHIPVYQTFHTALSYLMYIFH